MGQCQACAAYNDDSARFCAACGAALQPLATPPSSEERVIASMAHMPNGTAALGETNGNGNTAPPAAPAPAVTPTPSWVEQPAAPVTPVPAAAAPAAPFQPTSESPYSPPASDAATMPAVAPIAAAPAPRRSRTWIPVVATAVCGIAVALVFLFLWLGSRSDAHSTSKKLAASQQSVRATTSSLKTAKQATTTANATVARERDALATANHQLADAEQSRSGLQNSIDAYKTCGADLSKFFQALESNNEPSAEAALIVAKLDCDRIDATIIPLTP